MGAAGERAAEEYLRRAGAEVLARRWRSGRREVDLIVRDGEVVAFVEVKVRSEGPEGPLEAVSRPQKRRIRRAAEAWIHAHPGIGREFRFDVVGVRARADGTFAVEHVPGAWYGDEAL